MTGASLVFVLLAQIGGGVLPIYVIASREANLYPYKSVVEDPFGLSIKDASNLGSLVLSRLAIEKSFAPGSEEFCQTLPSFIINDFINTRFGSTPTVSIPFE